MKKSTHPWWNLTTLVAILGTLLVVCIVEYFYSIPSSYLHTTKSVKIDIERPTTSSPEVKKTRCSMEYIPVCGADGKTYSNSCMANTADTIVVSQGECQKNEDSVVSTGISTEIVSPIVTTSSGDFTDTGTYHVYENKSFKYSFALPKYTYYQGLGARDGASHALAISLTASGVEDMSTAEVKVYFYKASPATPPAGKEITLASGVLYVDGDMTNPKVGKIIETILASVK